MNWEDLKEKIHKEIQPGHQGILECRGDKQRSIKYNDGKTISMQAGKSDNKKITYEMIKYAFECTEKLGGFTSQIYQKKYPDEYKSATCRYSLVGGY